MKDVTKEECLAAINEVTKEYELMLAKVRNHEYSEEELINLEKNLKIVEKRLDKMLDKNSVPVK